MKRNFIPYIAVALISLALASCRKDALLPPEIEPVTFTVQPELFTKASDDHDGAGARIDRCKVAVYMCTSDRLEPYKIYDKPEVRSLGDNLHYSFTVNLLISQPYRIVVWLDKAGVYEVNDELTAVSRRSGDVACNSDDYDAFYASVPFLHGLGYSTEITAKRPFAQLNLITTDLDPSSQPTAITLSYSSAKSFNPLTAAVGDETTYVTYRAGSPYYHSTEGTQHTLAMNYVFAAADHQTILPTVKLTALKGSTSTTVETEIVNVPVQQNYRTNVTGNFLTSPETMSVNLTSAAQKQP